MENGSLLETQRNSDLAIMGDGWFGVQGTNQNTLYTKDGSFGIDGDGSLVTADGYYVLGSIAGNIDENNQLIQPLDTTPLADPQMQTAIKLPNTLTYPVSPSTVASFDANLGNSDEPVSMNVALIDSDGNRNNLELVFQKKEQQDSTGIAYSVTSKVTSANGDIQYSLDSGDLLFDETGKFISSTLTSVDNNGTPVTLDFGTGYDGLTATTLSQPYFSTSADGNIGGELLGYTFSENGDVIAGFSNGEQSSVAKIAVYHFQNDQGLARVSGSRFETISNSGKAMFYKDQEGNNVIGAHLISGSLESSNVDLTTGLTDLIVMQRSYDANSKIITTADEMIQKALQMSAN
jgi:flagellar hook protein FlgE